MSHLAIVNLSPPYGNSAGQEALDLALATASFGRPVSLFFIGDGVFQLLKDQQPEEIGRKHFTKSFAALPFYDIEDIFVCQASLQERGLDASRLCVPCMIMDNKSIREKLANHKHTVTFR